MKAEVALVLELAVRARCALAPARVVLTGSAVVDGRSVGGRVHVAVVGIAEVTALRATRLFGGTATQVGAFGSPARSALTLVRDGRRTVRRYCTRSVRV